MGEFLQLVQAVKTLVELFKLLIELDEKRPTSNDAER